ncbi:MAG: hypothetical protein HFJ66_01500 [Eggerthellaceae bacterium]|nr:hypothetical protein [Eggerthellaceae bacterium]
MDTLIACGITSAVTLIGIAVSYWLSKKNLKEETARMYEQQSLAKINDLPFRVAGLIDDIESGKLDPDSMKQLLSTIYAYGSPDAIKIIVAFQENNFRHVTPENPADPFYTISLISVLITQLKFDLTGRIVNPECWFRLRINDYDPRESPIPCHIENIVSKLEPDQRFIAN